MKIFFIIIGIVSFLEVITIVSWEYCNKEKKCS